MINRLTLNVVADIVDLVVLMLYSLVFLLTEIECDVETCHFCDSIAFSFLCEEKEQQKRERYEG